MRPREALSLHDRKLMGLQINHSCYEFNHATAMSSSTWKTIRQHSSPSSCPHVLPASSSMLPLSFGDGDTDVPFVVTLTSHFLSSLVPSLCITFATKRRTLSRWRVSSEVKSIVALIEDSGSVPWKYREAHNCLQFPFQALLWPVQALHACDTQNTCGQSRHTHKKKKSLPKGRRRRINTFSDQSQEQPDLQVWTHMFRRQFHHKPNLSPWHLESFVTGWPLLALLSVIPSLVDMFLPLDLLPHVPLEPSFLPLNSCLMVSLLTQVLTSEIYFVSLARLQWFLLSPCFPPGTSCWALCYTEQDGVGVVLGVRRVFIVDP